MLTLALAGILAASLVPQTPARGIVVSAGGGATLFVRHSEKTGASAGAGVASVTMDTSIPAGALVVVFGKCENDAALSAVSVNGDAATMTALQDQSDIDGVGAYKIGATAGTSVTFTWTGTPLFSRVIVRVYTSTGGTVTFLNKYSAGGNDNPQASGDGPTIESIDGTNSGTHRLNVAFAGLYSGTVLTTPRIATVAGSNFVTESDTHSWWTNGNLAGDANDDADAQYTDDTKWIVYMMCFANN